MSGDGVIFTREEARRTEAAVKHFERSQRGILAPALKKVRASGGSTTTGDGGSGGGGLATNNCCDTIYQAGSVDLDGLEWATDYTITLAAPIGTVTVTDQGSGTWESDAIDVTCTVDEVTMTDEYTVTMTATGNAPGEVVVTVALTSGGGYGGAAGCCDTTEGGFSWKYVNCCIVDPLAGWSMTRDPSGFSGKECELGGCEICVTPLPIVAGCSGQDLPLAYLVEFSSDGTNAASGHTLRVTNQCDCTYNFIDPVTSEFTSSSFPTNCSGYSYPSANWSNYSVKMGLKWSILDHDTEIGKYRIGLVFAVTIEGGDAVENETGAEYDDVVYDSQADAATALRTLIITTGVQAVGGSGWPSSVTLTPILV